MSKRFEFYTNEWAEEVFEIETKSPNNPESQRTHTKNGMKKKITQKSDNAFFFFFFLQHLHDVVFIIGNKLIDGKRNRKKLHFKDFSPHWPKCRNRNYYCHTVCASALRSIWAQVTFWTDVHDRCLRFVCWCERQSSLIKLKLSMQLFIFRYCQQLLSFLSFLMCSSNFVKNY